MYVLNSTTDFFQKEVHLLLSFPTLNFILVCFDVKNSYTKYLNYF